MKNSRKSSVDGKGPQSVSVLLAYDNPRTCAAMLKMLDRISTRLCDNQQSEFEGIHVKEFLDPFKWRAASADAVELAMVAFSGDGVPGAALLRWLEKWAKVHAGKAAGLCFLPMGSQTEQSVRGFVRTLREIAARYDLGFIYEPEPKFNLL